MKTFILKEAEFDSFIQAEILPLFQIKSENGSKIIALAGNLGAGKTTFSKHLLHALGVKELVSSPTFAIINSYNIDALGFKKALHIDVYRVEDEKELDVLHFNDLMQEPNTLSIVEWADTIDKKIPKEALWISFEHDSLDTRKVSIKNE
jgi:tRNA threonylcarbamoyladenosine biosynthesis protein TsaE